MEKSQSRVLITISYISNFTFSNISNLPFDSHVVLSISPSYVFNSFVIMRSESF